MSIAQPCQSPLASFWMPNPKKKKEVGEVGKLNLIVAAPDTFFSVSVCQK